MLCYYLKRLRMHRKLWQCESRVFPYTHDVIWVFSLSLASLNVVGLLTSNFSRESLICSQGPLCISDIIGVSSVILVFASYNVVDLLVSNFSRESPICSWGPLRISDIIEFSSVVSSDEKYIITVEGIPSVLEVQFVHLQWTVRRVAGHMHGG